MSTLKRTLPRRAQRPEAALLILCFLLSLLLASGCGGSAIPPEVAASANARAMGLSGAVAPNGATPGVDPGDGTAVPGKTNPTAPGTSNQPGSTPGANPSGNAPGNAPVAGGNVKAASCAGFKNQTGITSSTILLGNASDIAGPAPGLFRSTQQAANAYIAYFNSTHPGGMCGRKLVLDAYDSKTDAGADQQNYVKMCAKDFAAVGSMAGFDSGGAATAQACRIPDIRSTSVTGARNRCTTCFSAQATGDHEYQNEAFDFYVQHFPSAVKKAALLYLNAGAGVENAKVMKTVAARRGFKWIYVSPIDVADFNYGPYVQQMKSRGVEYVQLVGAPSYHVRLAQAMQQANFKPQVLAFDSSAYDPVLLTTNATEGATLFIPFTPFEESQPELNLYRQWLQQVSPGAKPDLYGVFAWSAAKLFVEKALALGGKLNRASLVNSMRSVHSWTANGLHSPQDVGGKHPPQCIRFLQVKNGKFVPIYGTKYVCHGYGKG